MSTTHTHERTTETRRTQRFFSLSLRPLCLCGSWLAVVAVVTAASLVAQGGGGQAADTRLPPVPPPPLPQVTYQDLLEGYKHPSRWLTYSGDYTGRRHSPLKQITPDNVHRLAAQ